MNGILIPTLYVLSGVSGYATLHHGLSVLLRRANRNHLLFALLCLVTTVIILAKAQAFQADTVRDLVAMRRWDVSAICVFFSLFPWFIANYTGSRPRTVLAGLTAFWALLFFFNFMLRYGVQYSALPPLTYFNLPWGESVTDLRLPRISAAHKVFWAGILAVMAYSVHACIAQYRQGQQSQKKRARTLAWALTAFFGFLLFTPVVNRGLVEFIPTNVFGFFAFLVVMDFEMLWDSRNQKRRMLAVLDHLPVAISLKDLKGRYQLINRKYQAFFHVDDPEIIGKTDDELFTREQAEAFRANERLALERRREVASEEVIERNAKQSVFQSQQFPLLRPDGTPYAVCGVWTDITESRLRDETLNRVRRQVWHTDRVASTGAITGSLAHELAQPLSAILNNAQAGLRFLAEDKVDITEIREILQDIARDDKRAGSVINGLRAMLQKQETPYTEFDLAQCIEEVLELLHSEILSHGVDIEIRLEANLTVRANKTQMQQVILNLAMNALEAMTEQAAGRRILRVTATRVDGKARVALRDTGVGIPEDMLDRVFDGFYTTKPQGLGIGLEVCRSIMESHGGSIWAEANPDSGATFHFSMPLAAEARALEAPAGA